MNEILLIERVEEELNIPEVINKVIKNLGGIETVFKDFNKIIIKPNFVLSRSYKSGTTTNLKIIESVIDAVQKAGKEAIVMESSGWGYSLHSNPIIIGFRKILKDRGVKFIDPLSAEMEKIPVKNGFLHKTVKVPRILKECGIINLPKIKMHELTQITGAMKNLYGILDKTDRFLGHTKGLHESIADLNSVVKPQMHIADGIWIMEGNGPALGKPVKANLIFASNDPVYLDYAISKFLSTDPHSVKHLALALNGRNFNLPQNMPTPLNLQKPNRSRLYLSIVNFAFWLNRHFSYPLLKADILPLRDRILRQHPNTCACELDPKDCKNCGSFCVFDNFDKEKGKVKDYSLCKACHWCTVAETCSKNKVKEKLVFYPRGVVEFFGSLFRRFPKFNKITNPAGADFCPTDAVTVSNNVAVLNKSKCLKCDICSAAKKMELPK